MEAIDLKALARAAEGMTGSEIEQAFVEALFQGFAEGKEPDDTMVRTVLAASAPLSATMAERMEH